MIINTEKTVNPLPKHIYPVSIVIPFILIVLGFAYFIFLFPEYRRLNALIKEAERAMQEKDFEKSAQIYENFLNVIPLCKKVRLACAKAYFAMERNYSNSLALHVLSELKLNKPRIE